jgi:hypothetical protein
MFNRTAANTQLFKVVGGVRQPALATGNYAIPEHSRARRIWSPIATPPRGDSFFPLRLNIPNDRFWIGKSHSGAFAESIQLRRSGSCVLSNRKVSSFN